VGAALQAYIFWLNSGPFDCGETIRGALLGTPNTTSQANGALMRISPLGIFGAGFNLEQVSTWAELDADLTHPHPICGQINKLYVMAIAHAVKSGCSNEDLYTKIILWAQEQNMENCIKEIVMKAEENPPRDYVHHQGWVVTAFHNSLWQLVHASNVKTGIIDTVMRGGDTDTNAAICGALLGAVYGEETIPDQWKQALLDCRPEEGNVNVFHPRPRCFWPVDALQLADQLVSLSIRTD
jgi:ADP-ribosylglycohydrolase